MQCGFKERLVFSEKNTIPDGIRCPKCGGEMVKLLASPANHFTPTKRKEKEEG